MTLRVIYARLRARHPDCLIDVKIHYSPGAGGVRPFYSASATVNGGSTAEYFPPRESPHAADEEAALKQLDAALAEVDRAQPIDFCIDCNKPKSQGRHGYLVCYFGG